MSRKVELLFAALFALFFIGWLIFDMPVALGLVPFASNRRPGSTANPKYTTSLWGLKGARTWTIRANYR